MNINVIAATTNESEDSFSPSALIQLAKSSIGVPVTLGFDQKKVIGKVDYARVTEKGLEISASVSHDISGMYLVPGYKSDDYKTVTFGAIIEPKDKSLPKIQLNQTK